MTGEYRHLLAPQLSLTLYSPKVNYILLYLMPDNFTRQRETPWPLKGYKTISLNPLLSKSDLWILLYLMPDDFTHQREIPWGAEG